MIEAISEEVPAYRRPLEGEFGAGLRRGVAEALEQFLDLIENGGELTPRDLQIYVDFGRWEAGEGRRLESLLAAYRLGARLSWRRIAETIRGEELGEETVALLAESVFAHIDELSAASAEGFAAELADRAGERDRLRRRLIAAAGRLARGPTPPLSARRPRRSDGSPPPSSPRWSTGPGRPDRVAAHLPEGTSWRRSTRPAIALIPDPRAPGRRGEIERALRGRAAALGTPVPLEQVHRSVERARAIQRIRDAGALAADGLLAADEHLAALVTLADTDLIDDLAARRLAPLADLTPAARERLESTLLAWLDRQGVVRDAAEDLHVHPQTVRYRIAQLRELLGEDLEDPSARYELLLAPSRSPARRVGRRTSPTSSSAGSVSLTKRARIRANGIGWTRCGKCPAASKSSKRLPGISRAARRPCSAGMIRSRSPQTISEGTDSAR